VDLLERPESCVLVTSRSGNGDFQSCIEKCSQSCAPADNAMRARKRSLKTQVSRLLTEQLALSGSLTEQLTSNSLKQPLIIVLLENPYNKMLLLMDLWGSNGPAFVREAVVVCR
jgi:hypothetical protein